MRARRMSSAMLLVCADVACGSLAVLGSYWLRFDGRIPSPWAGTLPLQIVCSVVLRVALFALFALYRQLWSYAGTRDMVRVIGAASASTAVLCLTSQFVDPLTMPRSVWLLTWWLTTVAAVLIRLGHRLARGWRTEPCSTRSRRVLIVGAGDAGSMVAREMERAGSRQLPVGFIDDDPRKSGMLVYGIPVLGTRDSIAEAVASRAVDEILLAIPSASRVVLRELLAVCRATGRPVRTVPGLSELFEGRVSVNQIRDVSIEDLLGREAIRLDLGQIAGYLEGQTVLVTGAGGSIGSELCRQIARFRPAKLVLLGRGENSIYDIDLELSALFPALTKVAVIADVRDLRRMGEVFAAHRPTVVFHAAAHKHVPLMEAAPLEAVMNNVIGTRNVAELAHQTGVARFVLISTDKAVNPSSIMGATKRAAELTIQQISRRSETKFCAVRFGNVLGSRGSVVPLFRKQIARGGPVTVTHPDMTRYFMTIPEAASLVVEAGSMGTSGEVFVLDMGEPVRIVDLATELIRLSGFEPNVDVKIEFTGVRPGEKLHEELFTVVEGARTTRHERISVLDASDAATSLEALARGNRALEAVVLALTELESTGLAHGQRGQRPIGEVG